MFASALLTVLIRRGYFKDGSGGITFGRRDKLEQSELVSDTALVNLFADAIKAPLLSSDTRVQIGTLDLVFHSVSMELYGPAEIGILIEENIADYVFEILRLSGNKDPLIIPCLRVLDLLTAAEDILRQRLAVGFPTLLSVLHYVADIPLHPVQFISTSQVEELAIILTGMFGRYKSGELGMLSETFVLGCLTFAEILKTLVKESLNNALLSSLSAHKTTNQLLLYSLYLMKEAILYSQEERFLTCSGTKEIMNCIVEICEVRLLPWLGTILDEGEDEDTVMEILEIFHLILLQESDVKKTNFAESLASSSWISWSFGYLGLLPSNKMKCRLYLLLSSVVDCIFGQEFGDPIRNAYMCLPSDPMELMFLLGQRSNCDYNLLSCQSAVISLLYISTLFEERIADEDQVLASLEQYILVNGSNFSLIHLYSFTRGVLSANGAPYSREAEKTLFCMISEHDWDLLSMGIHPTALKWLFQQDSIGVPLSGQILNFCRSYNTNESQLNKHGKIILVVDIQMLSDLSISEDNYLASILVLLLQQLEGECQEDDLNLVMNSMLSILNIFPEASNQFCLNNISNAFRTLYYSHSPFSEVFTTTSLLVFNVLSSAHPEVLSEDGAWLPITVKLLETVVNPLLDDDACSPEAHLIIGILCLVLRHSTNQAQALGEASKAILLNTALISAVDQKIQAACAKGPALVNHDEQTSFGESLLLVLLLYFFSLKSLQVQLGRRSTGKTSSRAPRGVNQSPPHVINISCGDLCRLLHYGSYLIKLVASQCLLELLTRITPQSLFSSEHLRSMAAVTEGLVFYADPTVAMNCGLCSSIILQWEKKRTRRKTLISGSYCQCPPWIIRSSPRVDGVPVQPSLRLRHNQKPLTQQRDGEMVELFRELAAGGFLDEEQAAGLRQVFQAPAWSGDRGARARRRAGEAGKPCCTLLIRLMLSSSGQLATGHAASERLLKAIDGFQASAGIPNG
ncbi:unnamed protein product [Spirodela intermedia]|uniref:Uncharacterized protein n=1 Tax=Spirodela intermedia TaxID=51605 RepID=A0A7I8JCR1_SPIIN|nr:unnamed protein product [Spirodela intermedia]CAA6667927.1 unnamed protein product [Spirodela intermedia]